MAGEVRKLAEQSADSAKNISDIITLIQSDTSHLVDSMNKSKTELLEGVQLVTATNESFREIHQFIQEVAALQETSAATEQLSASSDEFSHTYKQPSPITFISFSTDQVRTPYDTFSDEYSLATSK